MLIYEWCGIKEFNYTYKQWVFGIINILVATIIILSIIQIMNIVYTAEVSSDTYKLHNNHYN